MHDSVNITISSYTEPIPTANTFALNLFLLKWVILKNIFFQRHAVSRTQQDRQREPSVRHSIPRFPPNSAFIACWVAELNTALCLTSERKKLLHISFPRAGIEPTTNLVYSHTLVKATGLLLRFNRYNKKNLMSCSLKYYLPFPIVPRK